ncbi:hypothetical protein, partial [Cellulomonas triticagri]
DVLAPIQSGDPVRAEAALSRLAEIAEQISEPGTDARTGRGFLSAAYVIASVHVSHALDVAGPAVVPSWVSDASRSRFDRERDAAAVAGSL